MESNTGLRLHNAVCPACGAVNRFDEERAAEAHCGACTKPIFTGHPVEVDAAGADRHLARSELPVVIDFWAPWCGPCRTMAPAFAEAARVLEPNVRLLKVNTDKHPDLAQRFDVRGIPTFVVAHQGREVARVSGAMPAQAFIDWVRAHTPATA